MSIIRPLNRPLGKPCLEKMRYIIGIDLGTTNSCVSYVDSENPRMTIQPFRIPQLSSAGFIEAQATLPSFCYLAADHEFPTGSLKLSWDKDKERDYVVGNFAQAQGAKTPTRLVQSAKSWLCNAAANRKEKILPVDAADSFQRISPVEAAARYLAHIKEAWNHSLGRKDIASEFEQQEIILTVPASFDEVARTLTAEAAKLAGLQKITLLEEPQSAFYSWIAQHEKSWEDILKEGNTILVCDVGGGTTDFSLIEVQKNKDGKLSFQRMAVGDHLLLGGDNMDAAIAHYIEQKLQQQNPRTFDTHQWLQILHEARSAKEYLLSEDNATHYSVLLQGTGSQVIQGSVSIEITREEILPLLLSGFFASCSWDEAQQLKKAGGMRTMGLPYENEPNILKHLAHFLKQSAVTPKKPDYILFNGGAMKPTQFQEAMTNALDQWFSGNPIQVLETASLDLAVGRGAAYYGKVRRGLGVRIGGGTARGYYLEVEVKDQQKQSTKQAITLLPRGCEEGSSYEPEHTFWLTPNKPIAFRLFSSHVRLHDTQGSLITIEPEEMQPLPPIHTILRYGKKQTSNDSEEKIPVRLGIELTAIGTLAMWLKSQKTEHKWSLEFQLRSATGQDNSLGALEKTRSDETFDASYLKQAEEAIHETFAGQRTIKPGKLMEKLEELLEAPRREWSPSVLRGLWETLLKCAPQRKTSAEHEGRWWNLVGFVLRPGFGYPLDDFRMKELWKIILGDLKSAKTPEGLIQSWICFRRLAGGLSKGQQIQLAHELTPLIFDKKSNKIEIKSKAELYQYAEKLRALAALELIDIPMKIRLGDAIVQRIMSGEAISSDYWALGRIGARHLLYGTAGNVVPRATCVSWVEKLISLKQPNFEELAFVLGQLARKTDQRELNLPQTLIDKVANFFEGHAQSHRLNALLQESTQLTQQEQDQLFGDHLPTGLTLEI